jgi:SpoVK/Ycf46/Vps4 family AAA+-type ATPase
MSDTPRAELFELELELPSDAVQAVANRLVGFDARYKRIRQDLHLLSDPAAIAAWSNNYHGTVLPVCEVLADRYPLLIFEGDVGTGKTVAAEAACDRLTRDLEQQALLFKLSTRVRGSGTVGQMSTLINNAFATVVAEAGKKRLAYLLIDEGDSLGGARDVGHSHHEDKVAVNTIIQKIDDARKLGGRVVVILCTNRMHALDPAIVRRAARVERFDRPDETEREALFKLDFAGVDINTQQLRDLVRFTGPIDGKPGFTFSDLRTRLAPAAVALAFPNRPLTADDLLSAAKDVQPSPAIAQMR